MLDQEHAALPKPPNDRNTYTLGSIGEHNIVIACLPQDRLGMNSTASAAIWMVSTFPSIKFGLMVGIGSGMPPKVRLGDVVVGTPVGHFPSVVQCDFGRARDGGRFVRTGALNTPPNSLLTALAKLETEHEMRGTRIPNYLENVKRIWPRLGQQYLSTDSLEDILFKADYHHMEQSRAEKDDNLSNNESNREGESCPFCDKTQVVERSPRDTRVHYGLIASVNQVIKNAAIRDELNKDLGGNVLCIDMEAAGLSNNFPCIVIRGICDYADTHKNAKWQGYAAMVAAASAKELLQFVPSRSISNINTATHVLATGGLRNTMQGVRDIFTERPVQRNRPAPAPGDFYVTWLLDMWKPTPAIDSTRPERRSFSQFKTSHLTLLPLEDPSSSENKMVSDGSQTLHIANPLPISEPATKDQLGTEEDLFTEFVCTNPNDSDLISLVYDKVC